MEILIYIYEAIRKHHFNEREKIVSEIYHARRAKEELEKNNLEHGWDLEIVRRQQKIDEMDKYFKEAQEYLKSLDKSGVL